MLSLTSCPLWPCFPRKLSSIETVLRQYLIASDNVNLLDIAVHNKVGRFTQHFVDESAVINY